MSLNPEYTSHARRVAQYTRPCIALQSELEFCTAMACPYAHSVKEGEIITNPCNHVTILNCEQVGGYGKACIFKHEDESHDDFCVRRGWGDLIGKSVKCKYVADEGGKPSAPSAVTTPPSVFVPAALHVRSAWDNKLRVLSDDAKKKEEELPQAKSLSHNKSNTDFSGKSVSIRVPSICFNENFLAALMKFPHSGINLNIEVIDPSHVSK